MQRCLFLLILCVTPLSGCDLRILGGNMPGGDRDATGCLGSGGYQWCARTNQCERLWELAEREGIDESVDMQAYCEGVDADIDGEQRGSGS